MITGYSNVSSVVVLWLMFGYVYFSYLIRIVVFVNRYRSLDCCTVLSGKIFLQSLLLCYNRTDTFLLTFSIIEENKGFIRILKGKSFLCKFSAISTSCLFDLYIYLWFRSRYC